MTVDTEHSTNPVNRVRIIAVEPWNYSSTMSSAIIKVTVQTARTYVKPLICNKKEVNTYVQERDGPRYDLAGLIYIALYSPFYILYIYRILYSKGDAGC